MNIYKEKLMSFQLPFNVSNSRDNYTIIIRFKNIYNTDNSEKTIVKFRLGSIQFTMNVSWGKSQSYQPEDATLNDRNVRFVHEV